MWKSRKYKKKNLKKKIWFILPLLLILLAVFFLFRLPLFMVKEIEIKMNNISCSDENQIETAMAVLGQNFFLINSSKIKQNLLQNFFCIKSINFNKRFPNKIKLEAFGREPLAVIVNLKENIATSSSIENIATPSAQSTGDAFVVDNEGVVFAKVTNEFSIPRVYVQDLKVSLGQRLTSTLNTDFLQILEKVKTFGVPITDTYVLDNFFVINSQPQIIFRLNDQIDIQLASLQLILTEAKIDSNKLEFVDLRYDKPIVRFAPKEIER